MIFYIYTHTHAQIKKKKIINITSKTNLLDHRMNVDSLHIVIGRLMLHGERMSAMFVFVVSIKGTIPPAADNVHAAIKLFFTAQYP